MVGVVDTVSQRNAGQKTQVPVDFLHGKFQSLGLLKVLVELPSGKRESHQSTLDFQEIVISG